MIKVVIIEDEIPARKKLKRFIYGSDLDVEIIAELSTVQDAIAFLKIHQPDLIFSDIELLDGNSFEIYEEIKVSCPIIFTTAYDQFWMDAFDSNGIAYLLKPFSNNQFQKALDKYVLLMKPQQDIHKPIDDLLRLVSDNLSRNQHKTRLSCIGQQGIYFLETISIAFIEADEGIVVAQDRKCKRHMLSVSTLKELENQLNHFDFFRINRSEIVNKISIENMQRYNKNILAIKVEGHVKYLKTSQNLTAAFREWVEK